MNVSIPTSANQNQEASLIIRRIQPEDAESCGRIAFEAHHVVATAHNFPSEHPSVEFSIGLMKAKIADRNAYGAVAERDGRIVGSIFLNTFPPAPLAAIGPLTVDPKGRRKNNFTDWVRSCSSIWAEPRAALSEVIEVARVLVQCRWDSSDDRGLR